MTMMMTWKILFLQLFVICLVTGASTPHEEGKEADGKTHEHDNKVELDKLLQDELREEEDVYRDLEDESLYLSRLLNAGPLYKDEFVDRQPGYIEKEDPSWYLADESEYKLRRLEQSEWQDESSTHSHHNWLLQQRGVCFGAKGSSSYGEFHMKNGGAVKAIKLVSVSGTIGCFVLSFTKWGCGAKDIGTFITDKHNNVLFPSLAPNSVWYQIPNYDSNSKSLVLEETQHPPVVSKGKSLRIWYGEALRNSGDGDNRGTHCVDVYADVDDQWKWKLQETNVCFGTTGDQFGTFTVKAGGHLKAIKLVHRSGGVRCHSHSPLSHWGGDGYKGLVMGTIITSESNRVYFPQLKIENGWYNLPNYNPNSKTIVMSASSAPLVTRKERLRIWYGEDLYDFAERDNSGKTCADVYAYIEGKKIEYTVYVRTSDVGSAGTNSNVRITLYGEHADTGMLPLATSSSNADAFEQDKLDVFKFVGNDVGPITKIRIGMDNSGASPGWHLKNVIVSRKGEHCKMQFYYYGWLNKNNRDVDLYPDFSSDSCGEDLITYDIKVKTSSKWYSGTDARVYINMKGKNGETGIRMLRKSSTYKDPFEGKHLDIFTGKVKNVGSISAITIGHDNSGAGAGWHLESVTVKTATCTWVFPANQWLENKILSVTLKANTGKC